MHMAAEVVAALPSNSSGDELEETIPESTRTMRDVKCELVARRHIITQAVSLGLNFGFLFFFFFRVQSQIAVWALKRMRQIP